MLNQASDAVASVDLVDMVKFVYQKKAILIGGTFLMIAIGFTVHQFMAKRWAPAVEVALLEGDITREFPALQTLASVSYKIEKLGDIGNLLHGTVRNYPQLFRVMFRRALFDPTTIVEFDRDFLTRKFPNFDKERGEQIEIALSRYLQSRIVMEFETEEGSISYLHVRFEMDERGKAEWLKRYIEFVLLKTNDLLRVHISNVTKMQLGLLSSVVELRDYEHKAELQILRSALESARGVGIDEPMAVYDKDDKFTAYLARGAPMLEAMLEAKSKETFVDDSLLVPLAMIEHLQSISINENGLGPIGTLAITEFGLEQSTYGLSIIIGIFAFMGFILTFMVLMFWALLKLPKTNYSET